MFKGSLDVLGKVAGSCERYTEEGACCMHC